MDIQSTTDGLQNGLALHKSITTANVQRALDLSAQSHPRPEESSPAPLEIGAIFLSKSQSLPPWWSPARDRALDRFWREVNILSGAVYAITSKLTNIPFRVVPRDPNIQSHVNMASALTEQFRLTADYGEGWINFFSKQVESVLTQDNGGFFEILAEGPKDTPVSGIPYSVAHLDPLLCQRTGNPIWPVIYRPTRGETQIFHFTRVGFTSLQPSKREDMYGVGLSSVSRAASYAQELLDIAIYKMEKMGSRPPRKLMVAGGGLDGKRVGDAIELVKTQSALLGNDRYVPITVIGSPDIQEPKLETIDLASLPEGFNEKEVTSIAINAIALAFGVDTREFWPATEGGVTRADAMLSHMKSRGKGPGQILSLYKQIFETKVLPHYLCLEFDYQDDSEDRQVAEIRNVRAMTNERILRSGAANTRVVHQNMLRDNEINDTQFAELELTEGRLPSGEDATILFYSNDAVIQSLLALGVDNPTNTYAHSADVILPLIETRRAEVYKVLANTKSIAEERTYRECLGALTALERLYKPELQEDANSNSTRESSTREDYNWDENRINRPERNELRETDDSNMLTRILEPRG